MVSRSREKVVMSALVVREMSWCRGGGDGAGAFAVIVRRVVERNVMVSWSVRHWTARLSEPADGVNRPSKNLAVKGARDGL